MVVVVCLPGLEAFPPEPPSLPPQVPPPWAGAGWTGLLLSCAYAATAAPLGLSGSWPAARELRRSVLPPAPLPSRPWGCPSRCRRQAFPPWLAPGRRGGQCTAEFTQGSVAALHPPCLGLTSQRLLHVGAGQAGAQQPAQHVQGAEGRPGLPGWVWLGCPFMPWCADHGGQAGGRCGEQMAWAVRAAHAGWPSSSSAPRAPSRVRLERAAAHAGVSTQQASLHVEQACRASCAVPSHGNLEKWAQQGVLLLNAGERRQRRRSFVTSLPGSVVTRAVLAWQTCSPCSASAQP